ncbi:hypothetical protein [Priestia flexa]|nr:hypothetical protein [Priestia flexa]
MELIRCKQDVVKKLNDYVEVHPPVNNDSNFPNFNEMKFPIMNG